MPEPILPVWGPHACANCGHQEDDHRPGRCAHRPTGHGYSPCTCKRFAPMKDRHPRYAKSASLSTTGGPDAE